MDKDGDGVIGK